MEWKEGGGTETCRAAGVEEGGEQSLWGVAWALQA